MHVKITYQSNQMWLGPSQSKEESCPQEVEGIPDEVRSPVS